MDMLKARHKSLRNTNAPEEFSQIQVSELLPLRQLQKGPRLPQLLKLFRGDTAENIFLEINDFVKGETDADEFHILRMYTDDFEVLDKPVLQKMIYSNKKMPGMMEAVSKRLPVLLEKPATLMWRGVFSQLPSFLFLIPITVLVSATSFYVMGTAALAYYGPVPIQLELETTWNTILDYFQLTVPLLINVKKREESEAKHGRLVQALAALTRVEKDIHGIRSCIRAIALELSALLNASYVQVLVLQQELVEEKKLHRYCNFGNLQVDSDRCPDPTLHNTEDLKITADTCVGYVALNAKNVRANSPSELKQYGIQSKEIHSVGGCVVSNILCIPMAEHSSEAPLVLELSEKPGGFSYQDEEQAQLFAKRAAAILSSAILLDYKKKAIRRHGIRNEVLANIGEVSFFKVKQLMELKFQYSKSFRKKLQDFRFSMRIFPDHQSPGIILYLFIDLGFVQRWQMRKSTLIRFILSMQQGYREIPYHNWKHACCVTHFAYLLLKKLELVKIGYMTDLEALTLIISCLAHDIDHRGRNNHFNLCTKSELYHLYKQEDSIMERHHIAVALSVLNSEDCNILENLTDDEYAEFLDLIQWNILATDLAKYMKNRMEYFYTLNHFDPTNKVHRKHFSAVIMTSADLCDNVKTWDANLPCVKSIFHEFFSQGDDERDLGLRPMPMMDRRIAYIPQIEIQFINNIVRPAYIALADMLPQTKVCLRTLEYFEDLWLVSTAVFDENAELDDPLFILDLKDMREEHLRRRSAPKLQDILQEHGVPPISAAQIGVSSGSTSTIASVKPAASPAAPPKNEMQGKHSIVIHPPRRSMSELDFFCLDSSKNWLCCYICRNKGLVAARAVRRLKLQEEYLDKRVDQYERKRSVDHPYDVPNKESNVHNIY